MICLQIHDSMSTNNKLLNIYRFEILQNISYHNLSCFKIHQNLVMEHSWINFWIVFHKSRFSVQLIQLQLKKQIREGFKPAVPFCLIFVMRYL